MTTRELFSTNGDQDDGDRNGHEVEEENNNKKAKKKVCFLNFHRLLGVCVCLFLCLFVLCLFVF